MNAVRTQLLEAENSNTDLQRKIKIRDDLIKTLEEREVLKAYSNSSQTASLRPPVQPPTSQPQTQYHQGAPNQPHPQHTQHGPEHFHPGAFCTCTSCCLTLRAPRCCCCTCPPAPSRNASVPNPNLTAQSSEISNVNETLTNIKSKIDRLQSDMVAVVNDIEKARTEKCSDVAAIDLGRQKPSCINPAPVQRFNDIEVVQVYAAQHDESVVSMDDFGPDSTPQTDSVPSLNSSVLTSQL